MAMALLVGVPIGYFSRDITLPHTNTLKAQVPALEKLKVSGWSSTCEPCFLIIETGKEQGIWAKQGLDPEWITKPNPSFVGADIKEMVASGIRTGFWPAGETLLAVARGRESGINVKIVAGYWGDCLACMILVKADSPIKTINDLDGKRIGIQSSSDWTYRYALRALTRFSVRADLVPLGNLTNQVVALKLGRIDALVAGTAPALRLVDSGELRILYRGLEIFRQPSVTQVVWATEDLIEQDPDLVRRFVRATLEVVKYLKENPSYAADLYVRKTGAPRDLAEKAVSIIDWQPSGRGSGQNLTAAVENTWLNQKDAGLAPAVKIEDAVDLRFLP